LLLPGSWTTRRQINLSESAALPMEPVDLWTHGAAFRLHLPRRRSNTENNNHMHNSPAEIKKSFTLLLDNRVRWSFAAKALGDAMPISKKASARTLPRIAGLIPRSGAFCFQ
jgi:hypothetical protein